MGVVIGYVLNRVWQESGIRDIWKILPHGIFELPAVIIALGLGLRLGAYLFGANEKRETFKELAYKSVNTFLMIILPLLVLASIIEGLLIMLFSG